MNKLRQFAGQTVIYGLGHIAPRIVYYLLVVSLLTYIIGEDTFEIGTYSWYYFWASVILILFSFRLDTAFFRFGSQEDRLKSTFDTSFTAIIFCGLSVIFLAFAFSSTLASWSPYPDREDYVRWFGLILGFDIIALVPYARLRLENRPVAFSVCKILNVTFSSLLILFFLVILPKINSDNLSFLPSFPLRIDYVFVSNVIASGLMLIILLYLSRGYQFRLDKPLIRKMAYYAFPLVIVGVANAFIQFSAIHFQENWLPGNSKENLGSGGVYDMSRRIASIFAIFTTAFNYAAEPFFFNNAREQDRENLYGPICRFFVLVGGFVILAMVFGMDIIQFIVEKSYRESIFIVPILLMAYLFLGLYYNISIWYKLSDKTLYGALVSIIGLLLTVVLNIYLLPIYGYAASAWITLATYATMVIIVYFLGRHHFPITYPVVKIFINLVIIVALIIAASLLDERMTSPFSYLIKGLLLLGYLLYAYRSEKEVWVGLMRRQTSETL